MYFGEKPLSQELILANRWADAKILRTEFPEMMPLLQGEFIGDFKDFNVYENGNVISRKLVQGKIKDPTIGIIFPGEYHFSTGGNTETLTVLEGELEASVNQEPVSSLRRNGTIIAPAGSVLNLIVRKDNMFYLCQYEPKK